MSEQNNQNTPIDPAVSGFISKITNIDVSKRASITDKGVVHALKKDPTTIASETDTFVDLISYFVNGIRLNGVDRGESYVTNPAGIETTPRDDNELQVFDFHLGFKSIVAFKNYCAFVSEKVRKCISHIWKSSAYQVLDISVREKMRFRDMHAIREMAKWLADNGFRQVDDAMIKFNDKNIPVALVEFKQVSDLSELDSVIFTTGAAPATNFTIKHIQLKYVENEPNSKELAASFRKALGHCMIDVHENPKVMMIQGIGPQGFDIKEEYLGSDIAYAVPSFYPWMMGTTCADYIRDFLDSDANVLVFYGPPGTGKSTFLRTAIKQLGLSAIITANQNLMQHELFVKHLGTRMSGADGHFDLLIAEDAEHIMGKRTEGNSIMSQLLNSTSGITVSDNFKLVLTSNLLDLGDVDTALLRHGRCYDAMEFGYLSKEQAMQVRADIGKPLKTLTKTQYTLAEATNIDNTVDKVYDKDGNSHSIVGARFPLRDANKRKN